MPSAIVPNRATPCREHERPYAVGTHGDTRQPKILVLLAACNGARWIREQMDSILSQKGVDLRVAIRDDCSTDATRWELTRFTDDERVRVISANTATGSAAHNFLMLIEENPPGEAEFVAFADQDDCWDGDKLARACALLAASGAAGYSSATVAAWEDGRQLLLKPSGAPTISDFLFEGAGQGCTFVLTATLYEKIRQFIATHRGLTRQLRYHDWLMYALARSWGNNWCFDAQPSMMYRQHAENDTGARGTLEGIVKRLVRIRQGWYRTQLETIAASCAAAAPANDMVHEWHHEFLQPQSWRRRLGIARFCLHGGRRRRRDNLIVMLAAFAGWI